MKIKARQREKTIKIPAVHLCLEFVNDTSGCNQGEVGQLKEPEELLRWFEKTKKKFQGSAAGFFPEAMANYLPSGEEVRELKRLASALLELLKAWTTKTDPSRTDLSNFRGFLSYHQARKSLKIDASGLRWVFKFSNPQNKKLLIPVLISAIELLTSENFYRVRRCPGEGCGIFFVDTTKNGRRRWCSMKRCGSRFKSKKSYELKKAKLQKLQAPKTIE